MLDPDKPCSAISALPRISRRWRKRNRRNLLKRLWRKAGSCLCGSRHVRDAGADGRSPAYPGTSRYHPYTDGNSTMHVWENLERARRIERPTL